MSEPGITAGIEKLRAEALDIFQAGIAEADPARAVERALGAAGSLPVPGPGGVIRAVAFGKAACSMGQALGAVLAEAGLGWSGLAVVNRENLAEIDGFRVLVGGHPLPDEAGVEASREVAEFVAEAGENDLTFLLVSGGGSAILSAPAEGITLADKLDCTSRLLACGADIGEINTVRKHLSFLKGGGLAARLGGGELVTLILSDVIGDELSTIASGPAVADPTTFSDSTAVLRARGIYDEVSPGVRERLEAGCRGELPEMVVLVVWIEKPTARIGRDVVVGLVPARIRGLLLQDLVSLLVGSATVMVSCATDLTGDHQADQRQQSQCFERKRSPRMQGAHH